MDLYRYILGSHSSLPRFFHVHLCMTMAQVTQQLKPGGLQGTKKGLSSIGIHGANQKKTQQL